MTTPTPDLLALAIDALKQVSQTITMEDHLHPDYGWGEWLTEHVSPTIAALEAAKAQPTEPTAKEVHLMDLYAALGIEWGDNVFLAVSRLKAAQPVGVPGWKLVPIEPTNNMQYDAMNAAFHTSGAPDWTIAVWKAMLASAPAPVVELVHCPNCPDQGWYAIETGGCGPDGENDTRQMEQVQCEFCYTTPNSVFNAANPSAPVELPVVAQGIKK